MRTGLGDWPALLLLAFCALSGCVDQKSFRGATAADEAECRIVARSVTGRPQPSNCASDDSACEAGHNLGSAIAQRNALNNNYNDCMVARGLTEATDEPERESSPSVSRPRAKPREQAETWSAGPSQTARNSCYSEAKAKAATRSELERNYKQCLAKGWTASTATPEPASAATRQACLEQARGRFDNSSPKSEVQAFYRSCLKHSPNASGGSPAAFADTGGSTPRIAAPTPGAAHPPNATSIDVHSLQGCIIVADDGEFLGVIANHFETKSIMNRYGEHGNEYRSASLFNKYGQYGSEHSTLSPFNQYTSTPPRIFSADGKFVAYLTRNHALSPAVEPHFLIGMLRAAE